MTELPEGWSWIEYHPTHICLVDETGSWKAEVFQSGESYHFLVGTLHDERQTVHHVGTLTTPELKEMLLVATCLKRMGVSHG